MRDLMPVAEKVATLLKERGETIAVAESSTGGLISAALLAVPGASTYFLGGGIIYTGVARTALLDIPADALAGIRSSTEAYALLLATTVRRRFDAAWGVGESGAAGPTGNRYGDAAGHSCLAIAGPVERTLTLETARSDRIENMYAFAAAALDLLVQGLDGSS